MRIITQSENRPLIAFSAERAVMFAYAGSDEAEVTPPPEITILKEVTGDPEYKNKTLAKRQSL